MTQLKFPASSTCGLYLTPFLCNIEAIDPGFPRICYVHLHSSQSLKDLHGAASISLAYKDGYPVASVWGWVAVSFANVLLGIAMAEVLSAYPVCGGPYLWCACHLRDFLCLVQLLLHILHAVVEMSATRGCLTGSLTFKLFHADTAHSFGLVQKLPLMLLLVSSCMQD